MSDDKIKRRRFLADLLFAGGAVSAAALLAKVTQTKGQTTVATGSPLPTPACTSTPAGTSTPQPPVQLDGDVAVPQKPVPEPRLGGAVAPPMPQQPRVKGDAAPPRPKPNL